MTLPATGSSISTDGGGSNDVRSDALELIFLGTGTSSSLPHVECLTAPPDSVPCKTCLSTLTPEGKKNARRNTSAVIRVKGKDDKPSTIVIDVGKTFLSSALEWFPKYGLRRIDAVLITHAHADAMNGLDDLRGWTLNGNIQSHIDLYASQATFGEVQRAFPYLVSKEFASGGGDVPEFRWHIIEDRVPFECAGIMITPFSVHHGRVFRKSPPPGNLPTPTYTAPPTPISGRNSPLPSTAAILCHDQASSVDALEPNKPSPYLCTGFKIQDAVVYISDVSHIPESTWSLLLAPETPGGQARVPAVFVLDCLRIKPHMSHFGLKQAVDAVRRLKARRSYLVGFTHDLTHEDYAEILQAIGEVSVSISDASETVRGALEVMSEGEPQWVRPAYDGLRMFISPDGSVVEQ
ncbi:hypothetical protein M0805_000306 [Coniferiporia weirii]|nr:hypothetical protein M0805_000306 [Coniferiporia weirii]